MYMENSMNSMRKSLSSCSSYDSFEESGWTMYFEDFFGNKDNDHDHADQPAAGSFSIVDQQSSSLVSDAASFVIKKPSEDDVKNEQVGGLSIDNKSYNRLSFKKRRTKGTLVDDALEDTASSPVNSPKIYDMMNQYNRNMKQDIVKEKASGSRPEDDERRDFGFIDRESDGSELKKRGLCLVPLSMVVNYLGK